MTVEEGGQKVMDNEYGHILRLTKSDFLHCRPSVFWAVGSRRVPGGWKTQYREANGEPAGTRVKDSHRTAMRWTHVRDKGRG